MSKTSEAPATEAQRGLIEASIRPAGIITPAELMGRRFKEPDGLYLQDSPIHSYLITRPDSKREIVGIMPNSRLNSMDFLRFLHHLAPINNFDPDLDGVIVDYKQINPDDRFFDADLHQQHLLTLGTTWTDFMEHFPQFNRTLQEVDQVVLSSILSRAGITDDQITLGSVRLPGQTWTSPCPITLTESQKSGHTLLQREFVGPEPDSVDDRPRKFYNPNDAERIHLSAYLNNADLVIIFRDTLRAEMPREAIIRGIDLDKVKITTTNVIIPTFRFKLPQLTDVLWSPEPIKDEEIIRFFMETTSADTLPEGLTFDPNRFDTLAGGLTAAYLSGGKQKNWAHHATFTKGKRFKAMEAVQVAAQALQHREEIPRLPFAIRYVNHVLSTAA